MKRFGVKRGDLARALAERSRLTSGEMTARQTTPAPLTLAQAQDEVDRVVHGIVKKLRQGQRAEMPGVGIMTAQISVDTQHATAANPAAKKKMAPPVRKPKS